MRVDRFCTNARIFAGTNKGGLEGEFIFRQCDKQTVRRLYAVAGDTFQNLVFANTFTRRFCVSDGIARTAVQQAVVTSCRAGSDIVAFY
ncbi:hypothetical protein D3C73_1486580 [compost metagenome]